MCGSRKSAASFKQRLRDSLLLLSFPLKFLHGSVVVVVMSHDEMFSPEFNLQLALLLETQNQLPRKNILSDVNLNFYRREKSNILNYEWNNHVHF